LTYLLLTTQNICINSSIFSISSCSAPEMIGKWLTNHMLNVNISSQSIQDINSTILHLDLIRSSCIHNDLLICSSTRWCRPCCLTTLTLCIFISSFVVFLCFNSVTHVSYTAYFPNKVVVFLLDACITLRLCRNGLLENPSFFFLSFLIKQSIFASCLLHITSINGITTLCLFPIYLPNRSFETLLAWFIRLFFFPDNQTIHLRLLPFAHNIRQWHHNLVSTEILMLSLPHHDKILDPFTSHPSF